MASQVERIPHTHLGHTLRAVIKPFKLRVHMHAVGLAGRSWLGHHPLAVIRLYMCEHGHPRLGPGDWQAGGSGQHPESWNHCLPLIPHWKPPQGD